ncbi:response regulator [Actinopolymorpha singaporensis]|uniref:DNA-binding response regulator, NarL/FixJ family, contains REC and HTH domains n=1 Tax=Actinopolymorpha singaporensis TaxID=117157 RepID=A0A1H1LMV6_9ACTN|nr:response regulator transcription factor [Actinopolymorpha singaporensis]SDR75682.1 DNA-binding response regulator, NarL/FixJ family, contains REC and HTH domains [Actinopolymorpha singaporensis]
MTGEARGRSEPIRVLLADDQRVVREGLAMLLGLLPDVEVVGTAADGEQAVELAGQLRPDVVLMDLRMPRCDGIEATRRLRAEPGASQVIALTTYADDRSVLDALRAGARGYLTKDAGAEEIRAALVQVADGHAVIDRAVHHHLVDALGGAAEAEPAGEPGPARARPDGLTPREAEVLALMAEGLSNAEIAGRLVVGEATVKSHVNRLFAKLGVRDRAQAVAYAYRRGVVPPGTSAT